MVIIPIFEQPGHRLVHDALTRRLPDLFLRVGVLQVTRSIVEARKMILLNVHRRLSVLHGFKLRPLLASVL